MVVTWWWSLCPVPRDDAESTAGPSTASLCLDVFGRRRCSGALVQPRDAAQDRPLGAVTRPSLGTPWGWLERSGLPRLFSDARDKVISVSR